MWENVCVHDPSKHGFGCTASERECANTITSDPCCRLLIRGRGLRVTAASRPLSLIRRVRGDVDPPPHDGVDTKNSETTDYGDGKPPTDRRRLRSSARLASGEERADQ